MTEAIEAIVVTLILLAGVLFVVGGAVYFWALLELRRSDASMRAFSERWKGLTPAEQQQEMAVRRAMREL